MIAFALKRMSLSRMHQDQRAFVQKLGARRQVVPHRPVLHPEKFKEVMRMQLFRARARQHGPGEMDNRPGLENVLVAQ